MKEKIYKNTAGRKKLPPEQKKMPVVIYLTNEEIEILGGMKEAKERCTLEMKCFIADRQREF